MDIQNSAVARPALNAIDKGSGGEPLVLLHGFAMTADSWQLVMNQFAQDRQVVAYDLPGHGRSACFPTSGRTAVAADALIADIEGRRIGPVHLCGHSMGGAVACLMALKSPSMVRSLTLLAPGAFGPEINARLLRRFAVADTEQSLLPLLEQFYGWRRPVGEATLENLLADRKRSGAGENYLKILGLVLDGERQRELSREALASLAIPLKIIWGTQDRVLPTRQAHKLPGEFGVHVFDGVGHSIIDEIPDQLIRLVNEQNRGF